MLRSVQMKQQNCMSGREVGKKREETMMPFQILVAGVFVTLSEKINCALLVAVQVATSARSVLDFQMKMTFVQ